MEELIQKINKLHADFESYPAGTVFDVDEMAAMIEELKELAEEAKEKAKNVKDMFSDNAQRTPLLVNIPENIAKYIREHDGINLSINFNSASCCGGYAHTLWHNFIISKLTRTCHRCGYDPLWKPHLYDECDAKHSYNNWRYDAVFLWGPKNAGVSLEEAFEIWKKEQHEEHPESPAKAMSFGVNGYSG